MNKRVEYAGESVVFTYQDANYTTGLTPKIRLVASSGGTHTIDDVAMTEVSAANSPGLYSYTWTGVAGTYVVYMYKGTFGDVDSEAQVEAVEVYADLSASVTYCTAANVSSFLGLRDGTSRLTLSVSTIPTLAEVETLISRAEDTIDRKTRHSWRATTVTDEVHDYQPPQFYSGLGRSSEQRFIVLNHRKIRSFSNASGDKLEVWNGNSWVDYITTYQEGRDKDFYVDYVRGVIYFMNQTPAFMEHSVRVTYRFGEITIPGDITQAAVILTAINLISGNEGNALLGTAEGALNNAERLRHWKEEVNEILSRYTEV
jgi:hypothetical protein